MATRGMGTKGASSLKSDQHLHKYKCFAVCKKLKSTWCYIANKASTHSSILYMRRTYSHTALVEVTVAADRHKWWLDTWSGDQSSVCKTLNHSFFVNVPFTGCTAFFCEMFAIDRRQRALHYTTLHDISPNNPAMGSNSPHSNYKEVLLMTKTQYWTFKNKWLAYCHK